MPTALDLINSEKIAAVIFIISSVQALLSAFEAERAELEKQQNPSTNSAETAAVVSSTKLAIYSTLTGALGFLIFLIVAQLRKEQIERNIQAGTIKTSTIPNLILIVGFTVSLLGYFMRLPALQQLLSEATRPVVL